MNYEITITVDFNDADYNTKVSCISEENLERIKPLIEAIKNFKPYEATYSGSGLKWMHGHNYPCGENLPRTDLGGKSPEEIYPQFDEATHELFRELCPHGEYGFHTVVSVEITPFVKKTKLL